MKTSQQIKQEFLAEFDKLLLKYEATFGMEPSTSFEDAAIITIPSAWDSENNQTVDFTEIDLGRYRNPKHV